MWWLALAGFFVTALFAYRWGGRGVVAGFALGLIAGEAFAFFNAFAVPQQIPTPEAYVQYPSFVAIAGLVYAAAWWLAGGASIPFGLVLRRSKPPKTSS
jgi:putative Ca2+/H+ antiporter (TMEM165/GDT1 family)